MPRFQNPDGQPGAIRAPGRWELPCGIGALTVVICVLGLSGAPQAAGRAVAFRALDGRLLTGLMVEASQRPSPAVVVVPMLGGRKEDWEGVAQRLADANIATLAIDLPGMSLPGDPSVLPGWH